MVHSTMDLSRIVSEIKSDNCKILLLRVFNAAAERGFPLEFCNDGGAHETGMMSLSECQESLAINKFV